MKREQCVNFVRSTALSLYVTASAFASSYEWINSPAARSWERITGATIDLSTEAPVLESNVLRLVRTDNGSISGEFIVLITDSVPLFRSSDSIPTTWGSPIAATEAYSISSGCVFVDGNPAYFAFVQLDAAARLSDFAGNPISASATLSIPVIPFSDSKEAEQFMADVRDAADGSAQDDGGLFCHDPTWLGRNGTECCGYLSAYQSNIEGCRRDWWKHMWGCVAVGAGGGWTFFQWCAKTCIAVPPPANAGCVKGCLVASSVIGLEAAVVCALAANDAYGGCVARERAAYILNLTNNGCELRDPEGGSR